MAKEPEPRTGVSLDAGFRAALKRRFGARVRFDEPMAKHTSFRIGGPADAWVTVDTVEELASLRELASEQGVPVVPMGTGTNVLVADAGVRGVVLHLGRPFRFVDWTVREDHARVRAGAAVPFKKLVYDTIGRGFSGLEFGEGIPGSLGGGLIMNAGAFGGEIGRVVERIEGVHTDGRVEDLSREQLHFQYRRLDLPPGFLITAVVVVLPRGDREALRTWVGEVRSRRKSRQPLGFPNAGSVFKNPPGHFAGKLLEEAGFKGVRRGRARVSPQHANFIVNEGEARATDVRALMEEMEAGVFERTGIRLEREVKLVGDW